MLEWVAIPYQGIFPTQGSNPGLLHCRQILYHLSHREAQEHWSGRPVPSPGGLPYPEIKPASSALQADSLLALDTREALNQLAHFNLVICEV